MTQSQTTTQRASRSPQKVPFQIRAARAGYTVLGALAPGLAGRIATDQFLGTRTSGTKAEDSVPIGARRIAFDASCPIRGGYVWGDAGPTVLLVHGWGADSSSMFGMTRPLVAAGYRVVAFDAPAHGVSPGTHTTMTDFKKAVAGVLGSLGDVHAVIGHSLGSIATVAAVAARLGGAEEDRGEEGRGSGPARLVLLSAPSNLPEVMVRWSGYLHVSPTVIQRMRGELLQRNGVPVDHWNIPVLGKDLDIPVLVIHDGDDVIVPGNEADKIASALPNTRLHLTEGLGHRMILFNREVHEGIVEFLKVSEPAAARPADDRADQVA